MHILQGMIAGNGILFLQRIALCRDTLQMDARQCQILSIISFCPWSLRGIFSVFFLWLNKKSLFAMGKGTKDNMNAWNLNLNEVVILISTILAIVVLIMLGIQKNHGLTSLLLFLLNSCICMLEVVYGGIYTRYAIKRNNGNTNETKNKSLWYKILGFFLSYMGEGGESLVYGTSVLIQVGSAISSTFVGEISQNGNPQTLFFISAGLISLNFVVIFFRLLQNEIPTNTGDDAESTSDHSFRFMAIMVAVLAVANAVINSVVDNTTISFAVSLFSFFLVLFVNLDLRTLLGLAKSYRQIQNKEDDPNDLQKYYMLFSTVIFVQIVFYVNIASAEAFYFTEMSCEKAGTPRLTYMQYVFYGAVVSACSRVVGVYIFGKFFDVRLSTGSASIQKYLSMFIVVGFIQLSASSLDLVVPFKIFEGIYISSVVLIFFFLSYCVIGPMCSSIFYLPSALLIPKIIGSRASVIGFATISSIQSFCLVVSAQIGLYSIELSSIQTNGICDFCSMGFLMAAAHLAIPLCAQFFFYILRRTNNKKTN